MAGRAAVTRGHRAIVGRVLRRCCPRAGVLGLALVAGCSLVTTTDGLAGDAASSAADSGADVAAASDADGATPPLDDSSAPDASAVVNLHPNGDFDALGCKLWGGYYATLTADTLARSGTGSCRVCALEGSQSAGGFSADDASGSASNPPVGAVYAVSAWIRAAPGAPSPDDITVLLRSTRPSPFQIYEEAYGPRVAPTNDWAQINVTLAINEQAEALNTAIIGRGSTGACFLVDDLVLQRLK